MGNTGKQGGVGKSAALLTAGGMLEFMFQFLVPIVLVRNLDPHEFGQYRLLVLLLGTVLGLAPAFMPQSLFYYLPAASDERKRSIIGNVLVYLALMGCVAALAASPLTAFGGPKVDKLFEASHGLSSVFLGLSVLLSITTTLAIAEGRIMWHFYTDLAITLVRASMISLAALLTHSIAWVVAALVMDTAVRGLVVLAYLITRPGGARLACRPRLLASQLCYALPLALGTSLFAMRTQSDQWIAATFFSSASFAAFSIGVVVLPVAALIRQPINSAMLPRLSTEFAAGNHAGVQELLVKGSSAAMLVLVPLAGILFVLAPDIVALVYTDRYLSAVPVMRTYLAVIAMQSLAIGYAMPILDMGKTALIVNATGLLLSCSISLAAARYFGLAGAAAGSAMAFLVCEAWNTHAISRLLGRPVREMLPMRLMLITTGATVAGLVVTLAYATGSGSGPWTAIPAKLALYASILLSVFATAGGIKEARRARGLQPA